MFRFFFSTCIPSYTTCLTTTLRCCGCFGTPNLWSLGLESLSPRRTCIGNQIASSIDVYQADRGLATCFEAANIETAWRDEFLAKHRIQTLDDYVYMVTHSEWERSLTDLVDSCPGLKPNRVILSRFKAAWESGSAAVKQAAQPVSKGASHQLDEMLPESTLATVSRDFRTLRD